MKRIFAKIFTFKIFANYLQIFFKLFSLCLFSLCFNLSKCVKIFQFLCSLCLHSLVKISRHKSLPIFAPIFSLPFVKFSEKFWKSLHLFIRANLIYPFIETSSLLQRFGEHWKTTYVCSRWNKTTPVKQVSLELRFLTWLHTAQVTTKVTICRQCELCQFGRWIFCKSAKILLYWSRANVQGIGKCPIYLAKGM